ncbi:hypothetical protein B0H16DRAFT_1731878 [Mycena metata]|uniref:Uncharacterized protein n=1 Tax=Mycena metata TaxID=1033252 RepID=A0AAD7I3E4_9AGAR|nr:hypothetical protein B0H16DRAFT_1731878 [Mycena metata]
MVRTLLHLPRVPHDILPSPILPSLFSHPRVAPSRDDIEIPRAFQCRLQLLSPSLRALLLQSSRVRGSSFDVSTACSSRRRRGLRRFPTSTPYHFICYPSPVPSTLSPFQCLLTLVASLPCDQRHTNAGFAHAKPQGNNALAWK